MAARARARRDRARRGAARAARRVGGGARRVRAARCRARRRRSRGRASRIAAPLAATIPGEAELLDVWLVERLPAWRVREALAADAARRVAPRGRLRRVAGRGGAARPGRRVGVPGDVRAPGAWTRRDWRSAAAGSWRRRRCRASGARATPSIAYDLRPFVDGVEVAEADGGTVVRMTLRHDPEKGVGRPEELLAALGGGGGRAAGAGVTRPGAARAGRSAGSATAGRPRGAPPREADSVAGRLARTDRWPSRHGAARSLTPRAHPPYTLRSRPRWPLGASPCPRRGRPRPHRSSEDPCTQSSRPAGSSTASRSAPSSRSSCSTSSPASPSRWTGCSSSPTGTSAAVGTPIVDGAAVEAEVVGATRGDKVIAFKYRPRPAAGSRRAIART